MYRSERHLKKKKPILFTGLIIILSLLCITAISAHLYLKSTIQVEAPKKDLGRKVVIMLPSGKQIYSYENLIVDVDGKLYYKGERHTIDLTGGKVKYKDWE